MVQSQPVVVLFPASQQGPRHLLFNTALFGHRLAVNPKPQVEPTSLLSRSRIPSGEVLKRIGSFGRYLCAGELFQRCPYHQFGIAIHIKELDDSCAAVFLLLTIFGWQVWNLRQCKCAHRHTKHNQKRALHRNMTCSLRRAEVAMAMMIVRRSQLW